MSGINKTIFLLCIFGVLLRGQEINYQNPHLGLTYITTEQGLSQGMVFDMLQDREGFLWIGTKDGLNRYDGYSFKVFTNDPYNLNSISSNTIAKLFEDSRGLIWIATESAGLNVYNKKSGKFHRFMHKIGSGVGISGNKVRSIAEDALGNILVSVDNAAMNVIHVGEDIDALNFEHTITRVKLPEGVAIKGIKKDGKGRVWVGGSDNTLYRLEQEDFSLTKTKEGFSFSYAVLDTITGNIFGCGVDQTPFMWDGTEVYPLLDSMLLSLQMAILPDRTLWIVSHDGLFSVDLTSWDPKVVLRMRDKPFKNFYSIPSVAVTIDQTGILWAGTSGHGLIKFNPFKSKFNHVLPSITVRSIQPMGRDALLVGRSWARWIEIRGEKENHNFLADWYGEDEIDHCLYTRKGEFIAMSQQVFIHRLKNGTSKTIRWVREQLWERHQLLEDTEGRIWIAGFNGELRCYVPGADDFKYYNYMDSGNPLPPQSPTTALYLDGQGVFWMGTQSGFARGVLDEGSDQFNFNWYRNDLSDRNSLNYDHVSCFLDDPIQPEKYLWICTKGGGLNRFDKITGDFLHINSDQGLVNDVVYGLLTDEDDNLWGSTNKGIFCMMPVKETTPGLKVKAAASPGDPIKGWNFSKYSESDGLQKDEFNTGAYAKLPDGRLVFGGVNGLNIFRPGDLTLTNFEGRVAITRLLVNNMEINPYDDTKILTTTIETAAGIVLNHKQNMVTLEFATLDFSSPGQNTYRYQLVGADSDWIFSDSRRTATYLQLKPGKYTFRVQGANSRGVWSDKITELTIKVLPPWYATWWAYGVYLLLIGLGIRSYIRFSLNKAKLQSQLEYETREAERVRELDMARTKLYTNITHEFRTPLTIILGMATQIKESPGQYLDSGLEMIRRNGQSLLKLVNEMLDLSKLESGKMELSMNSGDVISYQRYLLESFSSMASSQEKHLHFLPEYPELYCAYDPEKLSQIISNLISNALKFTPKGGHIYMSTGLITDKDAAKREWFIKVRDTGIGIPPEDLTYIFDRFHQADNSMSEKADGSGIGLALTKELVKLMKGEITVESPPGGQLKGSEFCVVLPLIAAEKGLENEERMPVFEHREEVPRELIASWSMEESHEHKRDQKLPLLLLVEDNQDVVAYVAGCLQDFKLVVGNNGQEGLEIATQLIPDLIISDVMMPVMDGFDMLKQLRKDERTSHIPLIMLTAKADLESKLEGIGSGADAYLSKPFHKEELLLHIRRILEMRKALQLHFLRTAGLSVDEPIPDTGEAPSPTENAFVSKVRSVVEEHLSDVQFDVETLSREVYLSPRQLQRKLDALTGCSPNSFIRRIRLQQAKQLLMEEGRQIAEVALDCGFQDPGYFTRVFKQEFGVTPAQWRKESS